MNRKQKFAFQAARYTHALGVGFKNATKSCARDAVNGASLLGKFALHNAKSVGRSARNAAADVRQGAKYGWNSIESARAKQTPYEDLSSE